MTNGTPGPSPRDEKLGAEVDSAHKDPDTAPAQHDDGKGYWYTHNPESSAAVDLLNLLREYREAEKDMRSRTRDSMGMGETDLVALRFLVRERAAGRMCRQRDLAHALSMSAPSTSALVDRLSRQGYIRRTPHPEDRRSVGLEILSETDREVRATLSGMHARMMQATTSLTEQERAGAAKFLTGMIHSLRDDAE